VNALESHMDKRNCLDMLAYLLCDKNLAHELGSNCVNLNIKLCKEILEDLKIQAEQWQVETQEEFDYGVISIKCQEMASLFFLEKRLEMIEQLLTKKS